MTSLRTEHLPILVVDDDRDLARTLADILDLHGYPTLPAASGREGLDAFRDAARPVAVALVDLRLPDMDGLDLADQLHALSRQTQVVILTGHASLDSAVAALRGGSQDYLVKPVDPDRLLRTVAAAETRYRHLSSEDALRRVQERHGVLLASLSELILVLDDEGTIRYASPACEPMLGYRAEEVVGRSVLQFIHQADRDSAAEKLTARVRLGGAGSPAAFRARHRDGTFRQVEAVTTNRLDNPDVAGLVVTVRDVTERRLLEEQLAQARRMDSIGKLAGGVAHDFNNLLTVMLASTHLLETDLARDSAALREVTEIRRAAESAARLTRQLLAFGRRQVLEPIVLDLNDLIRDSEELLRRTLREDIALVLRLPDAQAPVLADPTQLEQVLMNLVANARDAMPRGGRLVLETATADLTGDYVSDHPGARRGPHMVLSVTDTGMGMDEETRLRLFEPFYTTKGEGEGTGLGLATVHGIVAQSGGHLWVYSEPGLGTTFKVYLPRAEDGLEPTTRRLHAVTDVAGSERVLVVEDNEPVRRLIRTVLGRAGYEVVDVDTPAAALEAVAGGYAPRLLITDIVLPGMRGRELAEAVRRSVANVAILFISGFAPEAVEHHGSPVAAEHFLGKPFSGEELLQRARLALDPDAP